MVQLAGYVVEAVILEGRIWSLQLLPVRKAWKSAAVTSEGFAESVGVKNPSMFRKWIRKEFQD